MTHEVEDGGWGLDGMGKVGREGEEGGEGRGGTRRGVSKVSFLSFLPRVWIQTRKKVYNSQLRHPC